MFLEKLYNKIGRRIEFKIHVKEHSVLFIPESSVSGISLTPISIKIEDLKTFDETFPDIVADHVKSLMKDLAIIERVFETEVTPDLNEDPKVPEEAKEEDSHASIPEPSPKRNDEKKPPPKFALEF